MRHGRSLRRRGQPDRPGAPTTYIDPDVNPDYYQYHYQIFRIGNKGDGGAGSGLRSRSRRPTATSTRSPRRSGLPKNPPSYAATFKHDFNTRYYDGPEVLQEDARPRGRVPEHLPGLTTAGEDHGLPAQGADDARLPDTRPTSTFDAINLPGLPSSARRQHLAPPPTPTGTIVLTSKAWGHRGRQRSRRQLVDPAADNAPLSVTLAGNAITVSLGTDATGAITSTAAQVIDAINANPAASRS